MGDSNENVIKSFLWALDPKNTGKAFAHQKDTGYYLTAPQQTELETALKAKGITMQKNPAYNDCYITEAEAKKLGLELHTRTPGDEGYTFRKNGGVVIDGDAEEKHR